ncbi:unnamed protein product, partial [Rotaria sp. Silwood1]
NSDNKGICHVYGDPHIIRFAQQSSVPQDQYWCKMSGEHLILKNDYVEIKTVMQYQTWFIVNFNIIFFKEDGTILCTITDNEQYCNSSEIKITRPSLSQINILYITPQLHISMVPHQYQLDSYDMNIRMPYDLIRQSNGLCIISSVENCEIENSIEDEEENNINSLSKLICEQYLTASIQASNQLSLVNNPDIHNNALIACIHDYQTTGNKNVGISIIDMIIKHGINSKQLNNLQFDLLTIESMSIIDNAIANASAQINIILPSTTTTQISVQNTTKEIITSSMITITQTTTLSSLFSETTTTTTLTNLISTSTSSRLPSTTISSSLSSTTRLSTPCPTTTTSDCSITVKSINVVIISFLFFYLLLNYFIF